MATGRSDVLITGGGTAGHVFPALAVAHALVRRGHDPSRIQFVGARHGMERGLVPASGFPITLLPGRGIVRRASLSNIGAIAGLCVAFGYSLLLVARRRPRVVVSVGGYGGVACSLAAFFWRVPVVTVNVDAIAGAANRLVGRFAAVSAVAYEGTALSRSIVTGVPVRDAVLGVDRSPAGRESARQALGIAKGRFVIAFVGGFLGSSRLNAAASGLRRLFAKRDDLVLYHVSGSRDHDALVALAPKEPGEAIDYRLVAFEERLPELFVAADIVVARAGAMTVAELRVIGVPSILVPLPGAPGDHQTKNAQALERVGAALVVEDALATPEHLAPLLASLLADRPRLAAMATAARSGGNEEAAASIAALIDRVGEGWRVGKDPL